MAFLHLILKVSIFLYFHMYLSSFSQFLSSFLQSVSVVLLKHDYFRGFPANEDVLLGNEGVDVRP